MIYPKQGLWRTDGRYYTDDEGEIYFVPDRSRWNRFWAWVLGVSLPRVRVYIEEQRTEARLWHDPFTDAGA